jgi:alpha-L-fucosidase
MPRVAALVVFVLILLVPVSAAEAAPGQLGIFIHYGPSTLLNKSSETDWMRGVWADDYPTLASGFRPNPAAAASWVALAKRAGATYIVLTAKHHDGYTLWPTAAGKDERASGASRVPQWGSTSQQDVVGSLAKAARAAGIKLYLYYSLPDWYSHSYRVADPVRYLPIVETQLRELLTQYGAIGGVWLDGVWDRPPEFWHLDEIKALIRSLQPSAKIAVNRHPSTVEADEDFQIFEKTYPAAVGAVPAEATYPIGRMWFYSSLDRAKTAKQLRTIFARTLARGINLLLDVPPRADGSISPTYGSALLAARSKPRR